MRKLIHLMTFILLLLGTVSWASAACDTDLSASTPSSQFSVDAVNGTVIDTKTGLMWKQCLEGDPDCSGDPPKYTWTNAVNQVDAANLNSGFADFTDWRLPNIKELQSIVEEQCSSPAINEDIFPGTVAEKILSNSPKDSSTWLTIDFSSGATLSSDAENYVRLVRDVPE
ncbi:Lcl C-terminal domain-containing protein [Candidatus Electrothrix sp.]|uniref:Lcl C-terminal domain-containing protein n=1 Tax=Candidatus Electrothrix sp. TaxID=2170559 RepID=UPI004057B84A